MADLNTHSCDGEGCTQVKKQTNHWFIGHLRKSQISLLPWFEPFLKVSPQDETHLKIFHFCGVECASKWIQKNISRLVPPERTA